MGKLCSRQFSLYLYGAWFVIDRDHFRDGGQLCHLDILPDGPRSRSKRVPAVGVTKVEHTGAKQIWMFAPDLFQSLDYTGFVRFLLNRINSAPRAIRRAPVGFYNTSYFNRMVAFSRYDLVRSINNSHWVPDVPIRDRSGALVGRLMPVSVMSLTDNSLMDAITRWRRNSAASFATQFTPTADRTRQWLKDIVLSDERRVLFVICIGDKPIGHVGLRDLDDCSFQGDNLVRGERGGGLLFMKYAVWAFQAWAMQCFRVSRSWGRVLANNSAASKFNLSLGNVIDVQSRAECSAAPIGMTVPEAAEDAMVHMTLTWENLIRVAPEAVIRGFLEPISPPVL